MMSNKVPMNFSVPSSPINQKQLETR